VWRKWKEKNATLSACAMEKEWRKQILTLLLFACSEVLQPPHFKLGFMCLKYVGFEVSNGLANVCFVYVQYDTKGEVVKASSNFGKT
jgi:hypothetical protein